MDITNPRRILAVSSVDSTHHLSRVIKDLTGTHPEPAGPAPSLAGTTHTLALKTAYYAAEVPVWLDLVASPAEWAASFLSAEAGEVLAVLGGVVVVFALPATGSGSEAARALIGGVGRVVREGLGGWEWDGVGLCVGVGEADDVDEWEDCCAEWGLEFVQVRNQQQQQQQQSAAAARNEFGEKTGIPRVLEALESNDWSQALGDGPDDLGSDFGDFEEELLKAATAATGSKDASSSSSAAGKPKATPTTTTTTTTTAGEGEDVGPDLDPGSLDFGFDREDFAGLKRAIWNAGRDDGNGDGDDDRKGDFVDGEPRSGSGSGRGGGAAAEGSGRTGDGNGGEEKLDDEEVQKLERMMVKLQAVRDVSAGLPEDQRRRMAARAVNEVMKEL